MMSKKSFATDNEIKHASEVLLPEGYCFLHYDEKTEIIKCNESKDIVACPGSGKTTTLLAKILILANRMPLERNKGVCVLTHTNVAIDEIKDKLGSKADILFRYPNHFGTIQSFIDKYLAIPYFNNFKEEFALEARSLKIDYEYYQNSILNEYRRNFPKNLKFGLERRFGDKTEDFLTSIFYDSNDESILMWGAKEIHYSKESQTYKELKTLKNNLKQKGILKYEEAFLLANKILNYNNKLPKSFSKRFQYVFIDEMQDTASHQIELLDKIFDYKKTVVQRFGDPYQSIYNKVSIEEIWEPRDFLPITNSCRFGDPIAAILRTVCINNNSDLKASDEIHSLQPIMLVYENPVEVLHKYCELLLSKKVDYYGEQLTVFEVSKRECRPIKAVGWVGNELDEQHSERLKLKSYFEDYHKEVKKKDKVDYTSLKSFLRKLEGAKVKDYQNKIIEAMLHILRIEEKTYEKNNRKYFFTKITFLSVLDEVKLLEKFNNKCSKWISQLNESESIDEEIVDKVKKHFIKKIFPVFEVNAENPDVENFLNSEISEEALNEKTIESGNFYTFPDNKDVKVEISNIHQVKGETHTATLYLETWYQGKFESESITSQMIGNPYEQPKGKKDTYTKETLKMAYVGMSRPRYLLCMAIHKDRFNEDFDSNNGGLWEIVKTY